MSSPGVVRRRRAKRQRGGDVHLDERQGVEHGVRVEDGTMEVNHALMEGMT